MPQLPIPQRGQPLDVAYINSIVTTINDLVKQVSPTSSNITKIERVGETPNSVPTSQASIFGVVKNIANSATVTAVGATVTAGEEKPFDINYSFKYPPIVVATPWNKGNTDSGKNVSVFINNVTTSKATLVAKFSAGGSATVDVNVLIIGIPN
jgi:hypothetical protein